MSHRLDPGLHAPGLHFGRLGLSPVPGAPTTVLAGVVTPAIPLFDSVWFQALVVFVAINTLFYAGLAVANLVPRRRPQGARVNRSASDQSMPLARPATLAGKSGDRPTYAVRR